MKISIKKSVLENVLLNTQSYLEKKDLSQIISHLYISATKESLIIKATDLEIGLEYTIKNIKVLDKGVATANGKRLLDIVKILKDEDLVLETINDYLYIKQNSSKFKLPMFNPNEFPQFPKIEKKQKFEVNSTLLARSFKKISSTIDVNNPKFELNGALIDIKDNSLNLVSTDTRRLAIIKLEKKNENDFFLILPKKAIVEIQKLFFDDIEMFYDENTLIAKSNNFQFYTKLINGKFPDYEKIIPKEKKYRLLLNRGKTVEAIKQIAIVSNDIKITFKPNVILFESLNDDNIEAKTEIEFKTGLSNEIHLAVNSKYVLDFLSNIEEDSFSLGFNESNLPFTLESENFMTIIMPIMI
ncbi:MAG: DNA polymerase III subunit beta [Sulfurospirillum sp.]|nr:DNA polymerase III subunit beta [Sulfurospirillum sp.]